MLIVGGILYGFIKLGRWIRTRVLTGLEKRRQHSEPTIIQLRQLQGKLESSMKKTLFMDIQRLKFSHKVYYA